MKKDRRSALEKRKMQKARVEAKKAAYRALMSRKFGNICDLGGNVGIEEPEKVVPETLPELEDLMAAELQAKAERHERLFRKYDALALGALSPGRVG